MSRFEKYQKPRARETTPNGFVLPEGKRTPNTLFVGGIDMEVEERELYDLFKKFGLIREVKLITFRGGLCKGYGFVYFDEDVDIPSIVLQPANLKGRNLKLGPAIMKDKSSRSGSMQPRLFRPFRPAWMNPPPQYICCSCCSPMGGGMSPPSPMVGGGSPYRQPYSSYSSLPGVMIPQVPVSYAPSYAQDGYNLQYSPPQPQYSPPQPQYSPPQYSEPHWLAEQRPRVINQNFAECGVQTLLTLL